LKNPSQSNSVPPAAPQNAASPKRARFNLVTAAMLLLSGATLWGVWRLTQAITPAAFQSSIPSNTSPAPPLRSNAPVAKDPKGAAAAFVEARRQEKYIVGPWIPTRKMLAETEKAVELDPTQPPYLVYLTQIYVSMRKPEAAIQTARQLLALAPEHPWGNVMLANQLLENGVGEKDFPQIEAMLKFAESDVNLAPGLHYGRGLLALRRHQAAVAVRELKQACDLDQNSSTGYYNLFLAEKMAGNRAGADWAMAQHNRCAARNLAGLKKSDAASQPPQSPK
jgi:predicted Zn-dependent protease